MIPPDEVEKDFRFDSNIDAFVSGKKTTRPHKKHYPTKRNRVGRKEISIGIIMFKSGVLEF